MPNGHFFRRDRLKNHFKEFDDAVRKFLKDASAKEMPNLVNPFLKAEIYEIPNEGVVQYIHAGGENLTVSLFNLPSIDDVVALINFGGFNENSSEFKRRLNDFYFTLAGVYQTDSDS